MAGTGRAGALPTMFELCHPWSFQLAFDLEYNRVTVKICRDAQHCSALLCLSTRRTVPGKNSPQRVAAISRLDRDQAALFLDKGNLSAKQKWAVRAF